MARKRIIDLNPALPLGGADLIELSQFYGGFQKSKKTTLNDLSTFFAGSPALGFIPIQGTSTGYPVTGPVEMSGAGSLFSDDGLGNTTNILFGPGVLTLLGSSYVKFGKGTNSDAKLRFYNATNNNYVRLNTGITANTYTLTLPTDIGTGGNLIADGSGNLSFDPTVYLSAASAASTYQPILGYTPENVANKGIANGYTPLDATGKVSTAYLPAAVLGGANYQGTWDASSNSPALSSGIGTKGYYYVVSNPGSTNLDGITDWKLGDWAIYNGTAWNKVDNTDAVISVNGNIGAVNLTGTTSRITISGSNVFDISPSYVGQASITTLGTIGTGTWQATSINTAYTDAKIKGTASVSGGLLYQNGTADTATTSNNLTTDGSSLLAMSGVRIGSASSSVTSNQLFDIFKSQNGATFQRIINQSTGTSALSAINLQDSATSGWLYKLGSSYTTSGIYKSGALVLDNTGDVGLNASTGKAINFGVNGVVNNNITSSGIYVGGSAAASARLHISAGSSTAGTAPIKLTSGTNMSTAETGAIEYNGTELFFTRTGTTRETLISGKVVTGTFSTPSTTTVVQVVINGTTYNLQTVN